MELNEKLKKYRMSRVEYQKACDLVGHELDGIEWPLFSSLWSEHCSYKSSKVHLKKFAKLPSQNVLEGFGENAGVVDLGEGERVAFKMESHNHPSFIEPVQGAATGVGGILRDIFTMNARPILLANYLCFGDVKADRMEELVQGVVKGISGYGNSVGVANVTGKTEFHKSYNENILVNALALGYYSSEKKVFTSRESLPGHWIVYVGAHTGRDGIHGASMASQSFDGDSEASRPTVQIGDPFYEKLLIESCLEVMDRNLVESIQDMGAAGLTSSSFEMASKAKVGLKIDLDQVPLRDSTMSPEDVLLSESQERMLLIIKPENYDEIVKVFKKWNLEATRIGEVLSENKVYLHWHGELLTAIDPDLLVDGAPEYDRPFVEESNSYADFKAQSLTGADYSKTLLKVLSSPQGMSKSWIYDQYDQRVGAKTAFGCEAPYGVVRLPESERFIGMALGCRPEVMRLSSSLGAMDAIFHPALQLASGGFKPVAVTDCLNYGNPEVPEVMGQFKTSVESMIEACAALEVPVISGNVSLYNETAGKSITPTPSIGMLGLQSQEMDLVQDHFQEPNNPVFLLACPQVFWNGLWAEMNNIAPQASGTLDAAKVSEFINLVYSHAHYFKSSKVVSRFGLGYHLSLMTGQCGFKSSGNFNLSFDETFYQIIVECSKETLSLSETPSKPHLMFHDFIEAGFDVALLGETTETSDMIFDDNVKFKSTELQEAHQKGWGDAFKRL